MYNLGSQDEINGDFGMAEHYDNSDNNNEEHIPRSKWRPIKKNKKSKPSFLTLKKASLKETRTRKINEEKNDETMDTRYNKDKDEGKGITLDYEPSTPDPPNDVQFIDIDNEMDTT